MSLVTRYCNGRVVKNHEIVLDDLWEANGKIIAPQAKADREIDVHGLIIAPGYIDLQINGGFGCDFSTQADKVDEVAKHLPQYGVTAFLPTIVSSSRDVYRRMLPYLQPKQGGVHGAAILGIHLEGPFLNPKRQGAHDFHVIRTFDESESLEDFYSSLKGVKMVTLAPEIRGAAKAIEFLRQKNIVVSAGHSNATYEEMQQAVEIGVSMVTHLFNAMTPFHQRDPGIIGAALTNRKLFYSIVADRWHLHPATIDLAWRSHPEGFVLVTDAIAALGFPDGTYRLGTKEIEVKEGKASLKGTNTIAGSVLSLDAAVRYLQACSGCSAVQAIESASWKPACVLGIQKVKGTLQPGADADFILLDDQLYVQACYIAGSKVYSQ